MVAVAIEVYVTIKRLYLENSSAELNVQKKMLEKENGSLLVQDLTTSRIIRKHEMLDLDNSNISHKRFNSPKIKSKRTLLSEEDFGYVAVSLLNNNILETQQTLNNISTEPKLESV